VINGNTVPIRVEPSIRARKTVYVEIFSAEKILIRLPHGVDVDVEAFINKNEAIIRRKYREFLSQIRVITPTTVYVGGEPHQVKIESDQHIENVELQEKTLVIRCKETGNASRILKKWVSKRSRERIEGLIEQYKDRLGEPTRVSVTDTTRWGYCRKNGVIIINWQLAALPRELSEYIMVHELVHLSSPNHQKGFYIKLMEVMPNYVQRNTDLRKYLAADKDFVLRHNFLVVEEE
jgi:predicted metal-dependent hydrolase